MNFIVEMHKDGTHYSARIFQKEDGTYHSIFYKHGLAFASKDYPGENLQFVEMAVKNWTNGITDLKE